LTIWSFFPLKKKRARRWLKRAVATRNKKRQKNALWLKPR
jgi:hypothetical protein